MKKILSRRKGFTLIEMLIVVAIIGILASVVVIGIGPAQQRARDSRRASDLKQIQTSLELFYNKNGKYPTGGTDAEMAWADFATAITTAGIGVNKIPDDPINNATNKYQYGASGDGTVYVLKATMEQVNDALQKTSLRGTIYTIDCGTGVDTSDVTKKKYCIGP
ncbi:MAG: putative General secretion pathway protein GspG [Parcubacteria group bacterium LiPW_15]|nr:MAG: putative General secretion pathway protein GspG [Parcubacteria group bacterium LiPW_15]